MAKPTSGAVPVARNKPRTRTAPAVESIALRHQIAVLNWSGTRRPCSRLIDRLFWILLSCWWPQWRESLVIVQVATVLRWRRDGWSGLWRYRSRGRWRGGRPRVASELRQLIAQMARENFLWGAPRTHGGLLILGFTVSQATVSRYLPGPGRRPTQSWRTFIRNQAIAFGHTRNSEKRASDYARVNIESFWSQLMRFTAVQVAMVGVALWRSIMGPLMQHAPERCTRDEVH
jgi:hypothetical protein